MDIRHHPRGSAAYSLCGRYRYLLRRWGEGAALLYLLLNPSTATEATNDPTVERCERRARALGFPAFTVANIFALRATDPRALYTTDDPAGPGNDRIILEEAGTAAMVLCGWGSHGALLGRGPATAARLRAAGHRLWHLGLTRSGAPRHPLYIAYATQPQPWDAA